MPKALFFENVLITRKLLEEMKEFQKVFSKVISKVNKLKRYSDSFVS